MLWQIQGLKGFCAETASGHLAFSHDQERSGGAIREAETEEEKRGTLRGWAGWQVAGWLESAAGTRTDFPAGGKHPASSLIKRGSTTGATFQVEYFRISGRAFTL